MNPNNLFANCTQPHNPCNKHQHPQVEILGTPLYGLYVRYVCLCIVQAKSIPQVPPPPGSHLYWYLIKENPIDRAEVSMKRLPTWGRNAQQSPKNVCIGGLKIQACIAIVSNQVIVQKFERAFLFFALMPIVFTISHRKTCNRTQANKKAATQTVMRQKRILFIGLLSSNVICIIIGIYKQDD